VIKGALPPRVKGLVVEWSELYSGRLESSILDNVKAPGVGRSQVGSYC
jgi:hypothetical protein